MKDIPENDKKIYHKTMQISEVFYVIKIYLFKTKYEKTEEKL